MERSCAKQHRQPRRKLSRSTRDRIRPTNEAACRERSNARPHQRGNQGLLSHDSVHFVKAIDNGAARGATRHVATCHVPAMSHESCVADARGAADGRGLAVRSVRAAVGRPPAGGGCRICGVGRGAREPRRRPFHMGRRRRRAIEPRRKAERPWRPPQCRPVRGNANSTIGATRGVRRAIARSSSPDWLE